ncbi:hypothetical protein GCM10008015_07500 [Flavobacterium palustre]|uniref:Uncharacterized protein n=1 Tax=Flavobacterium palustre TaxID=1476463 RepID=A0ABQ1HB97_9FLAO|nr:hypothetical protein GCM10008015_07500 [Flavobacterium palustre]
MQFFLKKNRFLKQPFLSVVLFIGRTNNKIVNYKIKKHEKDRIIFSLDDHIVKL